MVVFAVPHFHGMGGRVTGNAFESGVGDKSGGKCG